MKDKMYGNVNGWATHLLVATGKTDWVRDVADERGSLMEAIEKGGIVPSNGVGFFSFFFFFPSRLCVFVCGADVVILWWSRN